MLRLDERANVLHDIVMAAAKLSCNNLVGPLAPTFHSVLYRNGYTENRV